MQFINGGAGGGEAPVVIVLLLLPVVAFVCRRWRRWRLGGGQDIARTAAGEVGCVLGEDVGGGGLAPGQHGRGDGGCLAG